MTAQRSESYSGSERWPDPDDVPKEARKIGARLDRIEQKHDEELHEVADVVRSLIERVELLERVISDA